MHQHHLFTFTLHLDFNFGIFTIVRLSVDAVRHRLFAGNMHVYAQAVLLLKWRGCFQLWQTHRETENKAVQFSN